MRLLFTALACLISVSLFGQGWEQTYEGGGPDGTIGISIQNTNDGGYILCATGMDVSGQAQYEDAFLTSNELFLFKISSQSKLN